MQSSLRTTAQYLKFFRALCRAAPMKEGDLGNEQEMRKFGNRMLSNHCGTAVNTPQKKKDNFQLEG